MALFPKNLVWRSAESTLRDLRSWMAGFPELQVETGELFVLEREDTQGVDGVSLMTYDTLHREAASPFGTFDQIADATYKRRGGFGNQWRQYSAMMYTQNLYD